MSLFLSPSLSGRKPTKQNDDASKPDSTSALTAAQPLPTTVYSSPRSRSLRTSTLPGSEMTGVPASDTSATFLPLSIISAMASACLLSLNFS